MRLVPKPIVKRIQFYENHVQPFAENAGAIGSSPEAVARFAQLVQAARQAYAEQRQAMQIARAATLKLNELARKMNIVGQGIVQGVRSTARSTGDNSVFALANLPTPNRKSPLAAPGTPINLRTKLDAVGNLTLTWDCPNPRDIGGTTYNIWREVGNAGREMVAITARRRFTDSAIPRGVTQIIYHIQAARSTGKGEEARFTVNFGSNQDSPKQRTRQTLFVAA